MVSVKTAIKNAKLVTVQYTYVVFLPTINTKRNEWSMKYIKRDKSGPLYLERITSKHCTKATSRIPFQFSSETVVRNYNFCLRRCTKCTH